VGVWHDYRTRVFASPMAREITTGSLTIERYRTWMEQWIPQVRVGTTWMRTAMGSMHGPLGALAKIISAHAQDEQNDFNILFSDYRNAGGAIADIDALRRNPGGEALNACMMAMASRRNPFDLLGAIYIIEGTGQRIIPVLLPLMREQLKGTSATFSFLSYHGANDTSHLKRWLDALELVLGLDLGGQVAERVLATARRTAELYAMQWEDV
jgi:3-oxoacyl-[acyl-carrier-protein] synthase III